MRNALVFLLLAVLSIGCCRERRLVPVDLPPTPKPERLTYDLLREVLRQMVTADGRVDPFYYNEMLGPLDRQLARMTDVGPISTPERYDDPNAVLAYWYNARAAWALRLLAMRNPGGWLTLEPNEKLPCDRSLYDKPFRLDGKMMTLGEIDDYLACFEDVRVLVASPGVTFQRAPMTRAPFDPNTISAAVEQRFQDFLDDPKRLVIDRLHRTVRVPPVLWAFHDRMIRQYRQTYETIDVDLLLALLEHTSGSPRRRLQNAMGYTCVRAKRSFELAITPLDRALEARR